MDEHQKTHWAILEFVDEFAEGLDRDDIDFVADLIDSDRRETLTLKDCWRIRDLLIGYAGGWKALNEYQDQIIVQRTSEA